MRWTHENAKQTYRGQCPACAQAGRNGWPYICGQALPGGPYSYTEAQWHAYHAPLVPDAEWLAYHGFHVTRKGELDDRYSHAEPWCEGPAEISRRLTREGLR